MLTFTEADRGVSYRALAGAQCIKAACDEQRALFPGGGRHAGPGPTIPPTPDRSSTLQAYPLSKTRGDSRDQVEDEVPIGKVGILGAGCAGIYAAMILESLGIECEIHESRPLAGGRLHTHYFDSDPTKYQYYDVGAMRYPHIRIMERTFDLFFRVGMTSSLITYHLESNDTSLFYNNRRLVVGQPLPGFDPFQVSISNGGTVPDKYVHTGADELSNAAFKPYKEALVNNWKTGWTKLMDQDHHSTRAYMSQEAVLQSSESSPQAHVGAKGKELKSFEPVPGLNYPFDVIQWCETMGSATGLYNEAFSESVMDSLDFEWPGVARDYGQRYRAANQETPRTQMDKKVDWYCIDGGGSKVIPAMLAKIPKTTINYNSRVNGIARVVSEEDNAVTTGVRITTITTGTPESTQEPISQSSTYTYDWVLSSLPLSVLAQNVDTSTAGLDFRQTTSIRALSYDCSVKVGIRFRKQWWRIGSQITGGASSTDRPLRTCVYPSYGLQTDPQTPGVLLVSYTWAQDAARLGTLVQYSDYTTRRYPEHEKELIDILFRDLASLHGMQDETMLRELYMDHYAHNWFDDPHALGAFGLFGPGQFKYMYPSLARPAASNPRLGFIGEATSVHHGWLVGAFNSAWRGVYQLFKAARLPPDDPRFQRLCQSPRPPGVPVPPGPNGENDIPGYNEENWGPPPEEVEMVCLCGQPTGVPEFSDPSRGLVPPKHPNLPPPDYFMPPTDPGQKEEWWEQFTPGRISN